MSFWQSETIRAATGGTWVSRPPAVPITGLSTDTRTLQPGQVFLALAGDQFDGHRMVPEAVRKGSPLIIVDNTDLAPPIAGAGMIKVVDNTRRALSRLAAAYRRTLEGTRVVAVGGSNGKTTTVRLIESVLSRSLRGSASVKSFNNDIGVPLTILAAKPGDGYLICEVGTNSPGEIARLAEVVNPDIAVIASIGREHLEKLGSLAGVAREEAGLLESLRPGGAAIVSADSPELATAVAALSRRPHALITFGSASTADIRVVQASQDWGGLSFILNDRSRWMLGLLGEHNASNAAAAITVGRRLGLPDAAIADGLAVARGPEMRLERVTIGPIRLLNDAYNANPDSMRAGLKTLAQIGSGSPRTVAILGDMLEMGDHAEPEHRAMGRDLASMPHFCILVGNSMRWAAAELPAERTLWLPEMDDEHAAEAAAALHEHDTVLLKGSRRMRLERTIPAIRARFGAAAEVQG